jgi:hypothetical protein
MGEAYGLPPEKGTDATGDVRWAPVTELPELTRRQRRELRELRREELREVTRRRRREASLRTREVVADWLIIAGGLVLLLALFLPWSHQFSAGVLARYGGSAVLAGVARSPDAWQVYSIIDVLLALLAAALVISAVGGERRARLIVAAFALLAVAFIVHALAVPPTNGANLAEHVGGTVRYLPNAPRPGTGELLALAGIGVALGGIAFSLAVVG